MRTGPRRSVRAQEGARRARRARCAASCVRGGSGRAQRPTSACSYPDKPKRCRTSEATTTVSRVPFSSCANRDVRFLGRLTRISCSYSARVWPARRGRGRGMGVPAPAARSARDREAHLEVTPAFDFDPPPGEPSGRMRRARWSFAPRTRDTRRWRTCPSSRRSMPGARTARSCSGARACSTTPRPCASRSRARRSACAGTSARSRRCSPWRRCPGDSTHGTLATGGADASIRVWDPRQVHSSGAQLQHLRDHKGAVLALEQCVDKLVSGCSRGEVRLWAPYDARRPSDDDIRGIADAARRAPIGVTYALFQPLRVLCSFEQSPERSFFLGITGLSFGRTTAWATTGACPWRRARGACSACGVSPAARARATEATEATTR